MSIFRTSKSAGEVAEPDWSVVWAPLVARVDSRYYSFEATLLGGVWTTAILAADRSAELAYIAGVAVGRSDASNFSSVTLVYASEEEFAFRLGVDPGLWCCLSGARNVATLRLTLEGAGTIAPMATLSGRADPEVQLAGRHGTCRRTGESFSVLPASPARSEGLYGAIWAEIGITVPGGQP
jgi:hypothetical protein